ncbi:hypothetical protein HPB50_002153 [Hyalomma asiaticum]|uniref:Uncharacterized protein n=1 Tax=Hyalomma asiaticum TaxID=266040 RepID=A0ACB7RNY9_HYAAI|nr:hypothetical protein HPB50_002153 [Hyalomma asiaticum]
MKELQRLSGQMARIKSLMRPSSPHAAETAPSVTLPPMPAQTLEELEVVELALRDEKVAAALRRHLLHLGGASLRAVGSRIMNAIMSHSVQLQYSLHGKKGKQAFIDTRLCGVVTDSICQKLDIDMAEAHEFLKRWLPGAIDRGGGRKRRFEEVAKSSRSPSKLV